MVTRKVVTNMLKIPTKVSVMISLVLSVLFFAVIVAGAVILPWWLHESVLTMSEGIIKSHEIFGDNGRLFLLIVSYLLLSIMAVADVMLFTLLIRVKAGKVFTPISVSLIRGISWCVMLLCVAFGLLGLYFQIALFLAFTCLFLGVCLRVTKNVIEEATEIKAENDFTI